VPFTLVGQDGVFTVRVKVTDPDGAYAIDGAKVTVTNVAPTINTLVTDSRTNLRRGLPARTLSGRRRGGAPS